MRLLVDRQGRRRDVQLKGSGPTPFSRRGDGDVDIVDGLLAVVAGEGVAHGADEAAQSIGLKPLLSGKRTEDEGLFVLQHKYWQEAMTRALTEEKA